MEWVNQLDELKSSALKEMANIGISHVATAIGEISKEKIDISLPELDAFSKDKVLSFENNNSGVVAAYFTVEGISELTEILILLRRQDAYGLMDKFVNVDDLVKVNTQELEVAEQESIFAEISTVIAATYFSAIDSMFSLRRHCGIPEVGLGQEHWSDFINQKVRQNDGFSVNVSFTSNVSNFSGSFLMIPDPQTLDKFFKTIGLSG